MAMAGTASILDLRGVVDGLFGGCHGGVYLDYSQKDLLSGFSAASDPDYDLLAHFDPQHTRPARTSTRLMPSPPGLSGLTFYAAIFLFGAMNV